MPLSSIGYQGINITDFVASLHRRSVNLVVDVRLHPYSRKQGFSGPILAAHLANHDIGYLYEPALGNPKHNREAYRAGEQSAFDVFSGLLELPNAQTALKRIADRSADCHVALLCYEKSVDECHRKQVMEALHAEFGVELVEQIASQNNLPLD